MLSYNSLRSATGNFHPSSRIGGGGYGVVHRVRLMIIFILNFFIVAIFFSLFGGLGDGEGLKQNRLRFGEGER